MTEELFIPPIKTVMTGGCFIIVLPTLQHKIQATTIPTGGLPEVPRLCSHSSSASFGSWWSWWSQWNQRLRQIFLAIEPPKEYSGSPNPQKYTKMEILINTLLWYILISLGQYTWLWRCQHACHFSEKNRSYVPGCVAPDQPRPPALVATPPTPLVRGKGSKIPARPNDQRPNSRSSVADAPRKIPSSRWERCLSQVASTCRGRLGWWVDAYPVAKFQGSKRLWLGKARGVSRASLCQGFVFYFRRTNCLAIPNIIMYYNVWCSDQ